MNQGTESGTWTKAGENHYNVTVKSNIVQFVYQPETDTIAKARTPSTRFYPGGNGPAIITLSGRGPVVTTTVVTTQETIDLISALSGGKISQDIPNPAK